MSMRITNGMMIDGLMTNINMGMTRMNNFMQQLSSDRRIIRLSDDPIGVLNSMTARQRISQLERYQENLQTARAWVDQTNSSLYDVQGIIITIKENLIDAMGTKTPTDKAAIGTLVQELVGHIEQALNASIGSQYLFAGYNSTKIPFKRGDVTDAGGNVTKSNVMLYNGLDLVDGDSNAVDAEEGDHFELEVGYGVRMDVTFNGVEIVGRGDDNLFKILDDLAQDLLAGKATEDLGGYLGKLDDLHQRVLTNLVDVGARQNQIDLLDNRYEQDLINYEAIRTDVEDIDQAETIMHYKLGETIYQQALSVGARVIQPTLMDFLR